MVYNQKIKPSNANGTTCEKSGKANNKTYLVLQQTITIRFCTKHPFFAIHFSCNLVKLIVRIRQSIEQRLPRLAVSSLLVYIFLNAVVKQTPVAKDSDTWAILLHHKVLLAC